MSKVLKVVAVVAGIVAVVASGGAALAGVAGTFLGASAATLTTIAAVAGVVGLAASFGSQLLTKPPPARGSVNQLLIQVDPPQPYAMGRTYFGGVLRHTAAYGPTLKDVPNPYLGRVVVYSGGGPIQGFIAPTTDFEPLGAYYSGFLDVDQQLGACPESTALTPFWSGFPNWGAANKLSGQAAMLWNFKFDKDGKKFASGLPNTGAIMDGVKTYDPRLDSTYPGGTGAHRINNEATWQFSKNPALHAIAYAYGRYQNGKKTFGIGLPVEAIDLEAMVAWANVCDANDWTISGIIFEPDDRWKNLKDIMAAGGAEPVFSGAVLSVKYHAPRVSLDTITEADLTDQGGTITAMRSYRERINTIVPKWRSGAHNWEYTAGAPIVLSTAVTEDGEEKKEERQYNLVDNADQSAQLAAYELLERRELGTIELSCGPRLRQYRPGECLNIDLPEEGLSNVQAVILRRVIEPGSMTVRLVLLGETAEKHDYALGRTAVPPPTAALTQTAEQRDDISSSTVIGTPGADGAPGADGPPGPPGADGSPGAAGAPATSAYLTNEAVQLFAYANGNVVSYTGATGDFKVFAGSTDISASFTLSTQANPQALTIGYSGRTYTVTAGFDAGEDTATVTIRATGSGGYSGVVFDKVLSLSKAKGGYEIVAALPSTNLFSGRVVFNEVDDKLYRYTGTAWTAAVPAADVAGQLVDTQIQAVSASKIAGLLANSQIEAVAAAKVTGQLSDAQLAAISAAKLTGQIVGTQITDGAVTTAKVAAGAITAGQIAADTITAANIAAGAVTASELAAGSVIAGKVAAGAISATELAANSVVAGKIAANAVSANEIAANAVRVQHLLVAPNNLHPDPQFRDLTAWLVIDNASTVSSDLVAPATGWYTEEVATNAYGAAANAAVGNRYIVLWSGRSGMNNVNNRYHCYAKDQEKNNRFRVVPSTVYEFKCGCQNASNQTAWVTIQWFNVSNTYVGGDHSIGFAPGEIATKAIQVSPPANASYGRIVVYNEGNNTLSGAQFVSNVSVREAAGATMVVDGSIVAGKIAANAITADKIEAGAITAAKVGTNEIIAFTGNIKDLTVSTLKIAGNAVTLTSSAYTSTSVNLVDDAWVDVQSVTITTIGAPILILFNGQSSQVTSGVFDIIRYRILRDATVIQGPIENWAYADENRNVSLSITDVPSAGTITYKVQAFLQTSGGSANLTHRSLVAMETKR